MGRTPTRTEGMAMGVPSFAFLCLKSQASTTIPLVSGSVQGTLGLPGLGFP